MSIITMVELIEFDHVIPYDYDEHGRRAAAGTTRTTRRFGVRLTTADGIQGSYVNVWSAPPLAVAQAHSMAQVVLGRSLWDRERIWDDLGSRVYAKTDRVGAGAFDIALWDAAGRATGQPISALLGRYRDRLPAYVSTVGGGHGIGGLAGPSTYRDFASATADLGIPGFKLHGPSHGDPAEEIACLEAAVEGAAGRLEVMLDLGKSLRSMGDALRVGRACDALGLRWWEDPMRGDAPTAHRVLRERVRTPLLMTEFVRGLDQRMAMALAGGTDFLRADPELDMGITGVMKTAHAAESIGLDLEVHASGPAQRHCMAAIRNTSFYELGLLDPETGNLGMPAIFADDYRDDLGAVGADGCVAVPSGPGLGVEYEWDRILRDADVRRYE